MIQYSKSQSTFPYLIFFKAGGTYLCRFFDPLFILACFQFAANPKGKKGCPGFAAAIFSNNGESKS